MTQTPTAISPPPSQGEPNVPAVVGGALLLLVSVNGERWPAAGALAFALAVMPFRFLLQVPAWAVLPVAAFAGGALGAAIGATEVMPPGTASGNILNLVTHTARQGALQAVWVGGGLFLLWRALRRPRRGTRAQVEPRLDRVLRKLRPVRLAALLLVLTVTPGLRPGRDVRAWRMTMQTDLMSLAYLEARHHESAGRFTASPDSLPGLRPSPEVELLVQLVDSTRWRGRATHRRLTTICYIAGGVSGAGLTREPSDPVCRERKRWF